jgi:hypothetical protein
MKIASKIFKKYGFLVILGLLTAAFVLEIQAADGQYKGIDRKKIDEAIGQLTSIAQSSSLEDLVDRINKAIPGKMSFRIYKEEIINRITKMIKEFSQILIDYRKWSEFKPASSLRSLFFGSETQEPPVPKYPQYDALKDLNNDTSKLIKTELFKDEESMFMNNLRDLSNKIYFSSEDEDVTKIVGKKQSNLIDFLDKIKDQVIGRMAWWMWHKSDYPSKNYWVSKGINTDSSEGKKHISNIYYNTLSAGKSFNGKSFK